MKSSPNKKYLLFVLFANHWIWLVLQKNILVFLILILFSFVLFISYYNKSKQSFLIPITLLLYLSLASVFFFTTERTRLSELSSLQKDIQLKRVNYYPSPPVEFLPGVISYKIPYWLELKDTTLSGYRLQKNLTNFFDTNYSFFGSYPREMQTPGEFIKFPFIFLPFTLIGMMEVVKRKKYFLTFLLLLTMILVAFVGDRNHLGLFVNFPFMVLFIVVGLQKAVSYINKRINK